MTGSVGAIVERGHLERPLHLRRDVRARQPLQPRERLEVLARRERRIDRQLLRARCRAPAGSSVPSAACQTARSRPASSCTRPEIARISVVLPAPFGPSSASSSPSRSDSVAPSSATTSPNFLRAPVTVRTSVWLAMSGEDTEAPRASGDGVPASGGPGSGVNPSHAARHRRQAPRPAAAKAAKRGRADQITACDVTLRGSSVALSSPWRCTLAHPAPPRPLATQTTNITIRHHVVVLAYD